MKRSNFEQLVREAVAALSPASRAAMQNVAFIVEERARRRKGHEIGIRKVEVVATDVLKSNGVSR